MKALDNKNALKHLFDQELLKRMGTALSKVYPAFDQFHFEYPHIYLTHRQF